MQSIWSLQQAPAKRVNTKAKKASFSSLLKELFYTKPTAPKKVALGRKVATNSFIPVINDNHYRPQPQMPSFQQMMMPVQQQFAMPQYAAPQYMAPKTNKEEKNWSSIMSIVFPILLAVLGIPFYIMAILKLINFVN